MQLQNIAAQESKIVQKLAKETGIMPKLRKRANAFRNDDEMFLTAVGMLLDTRMALEAKRDAMWAKTAGWADRDTEGYDEVIIGSGPHGAGYAATRVLMGYPRPLIIEQGRVGGVFAQARNAVFNLNSRNRRGPGGLPSEGAALNVIPGAPIQGESLNMAEYQTNADLAYVVRSTVAKYADVRIGTVKRIDRTTVGGNGGNAFTVELEDGEVYARRVIVATGLGEPTIDGYTNRYASQFGFQTFGERVLSFMDLMKRFDEPFPLQDMGRVAVIGSGDSAKCAVESLLGAGPVGHMSVPMLDWIEQVDWFGRSLPETCESWRARERGRYQDLGSFLRPLDNGKQRLRVFPEMARMSQGLGTFYVNGRPYDMVIVCTGWTNEAIRGVIADGYIDDYRPRGAGSPVARQVSDSQIFKIGPAAELPFDSGDVEATQRISNNRVALFRLLPRTSQLAASLPVVREPQLEEKKVAPKPRSRKVTGRGKFPFRTDTTIVGRDANGSPLYQGDRIRFRPEGAFTEVIGTVLNSYEQELAIIRDDGVSGGGQYGSWLLDRDTVDTIYPIGRYDSSAEPVGKDGNGNDLYEGDRIRFEAGSGPVLATVVRLSSAEDRLYLGTVRDDGANGGGQKGEWLINKTGNNVELVDPVKYPVGASSPTDGYDDDVEF